MGGLMTVGNDPDGERSHGGSGGASAYLARRLIADARHSADLAALMEGASRRWPGRLLAETRFHLAGMVNAIELAIAMAVTDPQVRAAVEALGPGYGRGAIEREPGLLSPELLAHLRGRATVAALLRSADVMRPRGNPPALAEIKLEPPHADALAAVAMAEQGWCAPMLLDAAMRPDLPAEPFHDLAWSVAALLVQGCEGTAQAAHPAVIKAIAQATESVVAHHDEGQGAIALARRFARDVPATARSALARAALVDARLLPFAALVECETGLPTEGVIEALLESEDTPRHALFRLMAIDDATAFRAAELLAPFTGAVPGGDEALARFVESYRLFDGASAARWLAGAIKPRALADKLALIGRLR